MNIKIINPGTDMFENQKENIFLAFDENDQFLGNAYIIPRIHFHQTRKTPYLLFFDISSQIESVKVQLFEHIIKRARELRLLEPSLTCFLYTGFEKDDIKEGFYINNGLEPYYTIYMEQKLPYQSIEDTRFSLIIENQVFESDEDFMSYKQMYDEIFLTPLDYDFYQELSQKKDFKNQLFYQDGDLIGGCLSYLEHDYAYIETLFVMPNYRHKGYGKKILDHFSQEMTRLGVGSIRLEVWELNHDAVSFYQKHGFKKIGNNMMFPGKLL